MIQNEQEYRAALQRLERFQRQLAQLRQTKTHPHNNRLAAGGFRAELDRMQLAAREFLWAHPAGRNGLAVAG